MRALRNGDVRPSVVHLSPTRSCRPFDVPAAAGGQHVATAMQGHPDSRYPGCFFPHEMPPSPVKLTTVV